MNAAEVVLYIEDTLREAEGEELAAKLKLNVVTSCAPSHIVLAITDKRLELRLPGEKINPISVDFMDPALQYRLRKSHIRQELIARAVGMKSSIFPTVIDATAGLGEDALILAYLGCEVSMVERSPIICALLEDGLRRARQHNPEWVQRLNLNCTDAKNFLTKHSADVVYLDPMFPERVKSALVKKEMRILKRIVGGDEDAAELFFFAKQSARKRVVVKRPKLASTITEEEPSIVYKGKAARFDVYTHSTSG